MTDYFVQGGGFMWPILGVLILGIMIIVVKSITLTMQSVNAKAFTRKVHDALKEGGVERATEVCASTRGPVASIIHAGLLRYDRGLDHVEKAITNAASIEMAFLERGMIWLSTCTALAPMLGFLGTVWGMVGAFDEIEKANDISPTIVAGGIKVALLTTVFGLIAAMITQFFFNAFSAKINSLVLDMEESSVELIESLMEVGTVKK
jgi:biopolymer transport protein ExbB